VSPLAFKAGIDPDRRSVVVRVQMLAELEEIISYKGHVEEPDRQATQRRTWHKR
jgi:FKBP12-rapamycin complex-associated protein